MKVSGEKTMMALALVSLFPLSCWAGFGPGGSRGPEPPPQAIEACQEKSTGAMVQLATPSGETIKATCKQMGGKLVAVPEDGGPPPGSGVSPAAGGGFPEKGDGTSGER